MAGTSDEELARLIARYTSEIADYLDLRATDEQDNQFLFATYQETRYAPYGTHHFFLERFPVYEIESITVDGETLEEDEYASVGGFGKILSVDSDGRAHFFDCGLIVVTYKAGWAAPDEDISALDPSPPVLPKTFQQALFELMRADYYHEDQEPGIRSESSNQVEALSYFQGGAMTEGWQNAAKLLKRYKRRFVS